MLLVWQRIRWDSEKLKLHLKTLLNVVVLIEQLCVLAVRVRMAVRSTAAR